GFTNTTMNDIAKAAKRGRRTLYVYFKSKEDVYYAVVEQEMYKLLDALELVANSAEPPQNKLIDYIYT
ncbi:MAG TPA: TetR/AcrR family transcriptional regulator, partial [Paludibacteraceae bacterium]|nr:TetR/AcrR family transcriptional regulator [Paludibacteraceae bacterium]